MSSSELAGRDRESLVYRLAEELALRRAANTLDYADLASRHGLSPADVERCLAAVEALEAAMGEDFAGAAAPDLPPPVVPDDFEILGELGRGGMGVVYRVRQKSLDRVVALKVLRPGDMLFGDMLSRFQKEARSLARLRHRHIVSVHEVGEAGGCVYFTMDLIEGGSLAEKIARGEVTPAMAVRVLRQVASAIHYTHSHGLVHRDLKPANVLLDREGDAYVVDFGLARDLAVTGAITRSGHVLGTPAYMAPEQARGDAARTGETTDVYALGAILYECLAGRPPFTSSSLPDLIDEILHQDPVPPRRLAPRVPGDLEVISLKAMAKEPERRYANARAMLEDLERYEEGKPIRARRPSLFYRASRFLRRNRASVASAAAAAVLMAVVYLALIRPYLGQSPETLRSIAEDFHGSGDHRAAVGLYERAIELDPAGASDETVRESLARCRLEVARELEKEGRWAEAAALLGEVVAEVENPPYGTADAQNLVTRVELYWELASCHARAGNTALAHAAISQVHACQRALDEIPGGPEHGAGERIFDRIGAALADPADLAYPVATLALAEHLRFYSEQTARWLAGRPDGGVAILRAAAAAESNPEQIRELALSALPRVARWWTGQAFAPALAEWAADTALAPEERLLVAEALAIAADLPFPVRGDVGYPIPEHALVSGVVDPERVLSFWREVKELPRIEGYRRRIERAIATEDSRLDSWLAERTGFDRPGGPFTAREIFQIWESWWEEHGQEDPRLWLATALGISAPEEGDLRGLLDLFLGAQGARRARAHHLLALSVPATVEPPDSRSFDLAMEWYARLVDPAGEEPHLLRVAHLVLENGGPEPVVLWEETRPIPIGETVSFERVAPFDDGWSFNARWQVPGLWEGPLRWRASAQDQVRLSASLAWEAHGLVLSFAHPFHHLSGARWSSGSIPLPRALAGNVLLVQEREHGTASGGAGARTLHLTLAVAGPTGADPAPWGVSGWRGRLVANLASFAAEPDGADLDSLGSALALASHLAVPEARESLARIDAGTKDRLGHSGWAKPARLLAGDGSALEEPGAADLVRAEVDRRGFEAAYWTRLYLATEDPSARELAASWLAATDLPDGYAAGLEQAIEEGRPASEDLARRVNGARERLEGGEGGKRKRRFVSAVAFPGAFLALAIVLGSLAVWPIRSSRGRLRLAWGVLVLGGILSAMRLDTARWGALPIFADGYALAAFASFAIARSGRGWPRFIAPGAFSLAALAGLAGYHAGFAATLDPVSHLAAALGVVSLPSLARSIEPDGPPSRRLRIAGWALAALLAVFAVAAVLWTAGPDELRSRAGRKFDTAIPLVFLPAAAVAGAALRVGAGVFTRR